MPAEYSVAVDWAGDGAFDGPYDDVTDDTRGRDGVTIAYGRDQARVLAPQQIGEARLTLASPGRRYSPDNAASPLYGLVGPGREVRIQATMDGTTYGMYRGSLDDYQVLPSSVDPLVRLSALDPLARIKGVKVTTGLYQGVWTGEAIGLLLDAAGWPADLRDLDQGATIIPWWWCQDDDAWALLGQLADSEGPGALITVDVDGKIVFRSRHHRLTSARSITSQATWYDSVEPAIAPEIQVDYGWRDVANTCTFSVQVRAPEGELSTVWSQSDSEQLLVADGDTVQVEAVASDPFVGAITPEAGTDFTLSGAATVALSRTDGRSTTISISASGGPAVVTGLHLRAYRLAVQTTVAVTAEDTASVEQYGPRSYPSGHDPVWASVWDAAAITELIVAQRAQRLPTVTVTMVGANDTRLVQQLARDLSDRVHLTAPTADLDRDFFVEQIRHAIAGKGVLHSTAFGLEAVPAPITGLLVLDDAVLGLLDAGRLGGIGRDEPGTIAILDDPVQGVLDSALLAH